MLGMSQWIEENTAMKNNEFISAREMKTDLKSYSWNLLFNRKKAKKIREDAVIKINDFNKGNKSISIDECELMYVYVKTFGHMKRDYYSSDYLDGVDRINQINQGEYPEFNKHVEAKSYDVFCVFSRKIASALGRYDRIESKSVLNAKTHKLSSVKEQQADVMQANAEKINEPKEKVAVVDNAEEIKSTNDKNLSKTYGSWKNRAKKAAVAGLLAVTAVFGFSKLGGWFKNNTAEKSKTAKVTTTKQEALKVQSLQSWQNIHGLQANNKPAIAKSKQVEQMPEVVIPHASGKQKNYYDSALEIHLGTKKRDALYVKLEKNIKQGNITLPQGMTVERLAHLKTVSNLVQPNAQINKLLQEVGNRKLSNSEQKIVWNFAKHAGVRCANIKGTIKHSNFAKKSRQLQSKHMMNLQQWKNAKAKN